MRQDIKYNVIESRNIDPSRPSEIIYYCKQLLNAEGRTVLTERSSALTLIPFVLLHRLLNFDIPVKHNVRLFTITLINNVQ